MGILYIYSARTLAAVSLVTVLTACGGSDGSTTPPVGGSTSSIPVMTQSSVIASSQNSMALSSSQVSVTSSLAPDVFPSSSSVSSQVINSSVASSQSVASSSVASSVVVVVPNSSSVVSSVAMTPSSVSSSSRVASSSVVSSSLSSSIASSSIVSSSVVSSSVVSSSVISSSVSSVESTDFTIYIKASSYSKAPTIWAWIDGGTAIHDVDPKYTWNAQEQMVMDSASGYYSWTLPSKYKAEIAAGKTLSFKIDKAAEVMSRYNPGCYTGERWYDSIDQCLNQPFSPYVGPYLTLITPKLSGSHDTATVLNPENNMIVNYEIKNPPANFEAQVSYRKAGSVEWLVKSEQPQVKIQNDGKLGYRDWGVVHHIILSGLQAGTKYEYKVNSPDGKFSQQYHFTTAKTNMAYSHFLVVGDMQDPGNSIQRWGDVAAAIKKDHMDDFDFIITVGDMVKDDIAEKGDDFYFWQVFFNLGRDVFAYKAMLPAMGNHDTPGSQYNAQVSNASEPYWSNAEDTRSFRKYFYINPDMTKPDYYSYSYGNACFMSVNSEIPVYYGRAGERDFNNSRDKQSNWLSAEVDKAQNCDWSFGYWHVPAINPIDSKDEVQYLRPYVNKFNHKLDWSLTGHVHQYQRLKPLTATTNNITKLNDYGRNEGQGVGYLTAPPAGQDPRNNIGGNADMSLLAYWPGKDLGGNNKFAYEVGFTIIQVDGKSFKLKTYGLGDADNNRAQPAGYSHQNQQKVLLDSIEYTK